MSGSLPLKLVAGGILLLGIGACDAAGGPADGTSTAPLPSEGLSLVVLLEFVPVCGPSEPTGTACESYPLPGVEVTVHDEDGSAAGSGVSDSAGSVGFVLPEGAYEVRGASVPSAVTPRPAEVTVNGASPVTVIIRYESNMQ